MMKERNPRTMCSLKLSCVTLVKNMQRESSTPMENSIPLKVSGEPGTIIADPNTRIVVVCGSAKITEDCKISLCDISSQDLYLIRL